MKKGKVSPLVIAGLCLILCSLCLMLVFRLQSKTGFQKSQETLSQIHGLLPEKTPGIPGIYPDAAMPVLEIDDADYVAVLEIPAFGITLPVADQWDSKKLHDGPRRFWGSAYDNTLVVGGTDDSWQLAFCDKIENGTALTVTDMTGAQFAYTVARVDRAKHAEGQWLTGGDWDLTLFCHDVQSMEYIAVRCTFSNS